MITTTNVPNHHAHYPAFAGLGGLFAAATMVVGRQGDAELAEALGGVGPDDVIVDVGCGPGTAVRRAANLGASVIGVDPAPVMLRVARLLTRSSPKRTYLEGSAECLPLPDRAATIVWAIRSVHHWADIDSGLDEVQRVLGPGGRLIAIEGQTTPDARGHASHGWTDDQTNGFAELCVSHGFTDVRVDRHTAGRRATVSVTAIAP